MSETAIPDYSGFIEEAAPLPEDKMSRINVLVQRQLMLERKHAEAEELLKTGQAGIGIHIRSWHCLI
jgi:CHASE3 domain sensor protein